MERRHLTTAVTLLVLVAILVFGVFLGVKTLFAPLPGSGADASASASPTCSPTDIRKGQRIRSTQVQVSVFNGGTRSGLADGTMAMLRARGFSSGSVGNAPSELSVKRVRVFTTKKNDMAALLVARQFGRATKVTVSVTDLGPGIDVVVGNGFHKLSRARHVIVARQPSSVCVPAAGTTSGTS